MSKENLHCMQKRKVGREEEYKQSSAHQMQTKNPITDKEKVVRRDDVSPMGRHCLYAQRCALGDTVIFV